MTVRKGRCGGRRRRRRGGSESLWSLWAAREQSKSKMQHLWFHRRPGSVTWPQAAPFQIVKRLVCPVSLVYSEVTASRTYNQSFHQIARLQTSAACVGLKNTSECLHLTAGVFEFGVTVLECANRNPKNSFKLSSWYFETWKTIWAERNSWDFAGATGHNNKVTENIIKI